MTLSTVDQSKNKVDPFCVENNLTSWASSRVLVRGRDYYRKGNVLTLDYDGEEEIKAQVRGSLDEPYNTLIRFDRFGMPVSECTCPFLWEPLCKHAVAVLIGWQQQETGSEPVLGKADLSDKTPLSTAPLATPREREEYIQERANLERLERANRCLEQNLRVLRKPDAGPLGTYLVSSGNPNRNQKYQVTVRDAEWNHASCDCVDYQTNELGTCKHIERVKKFLTAKRRIKEMEEHERRSRKAWLYLGTRETHQKLIHPLERIRLYSPTGVKGEIARLTSGLFDNKGFLINGRLPNDLEREVSLFIKRINRGSRHVRLCVEPPTAELLRREKENHQWGRKLEMISRHPDQSAAWRRSVGSLGIRLHPYQKEGILFAVKQKKAFIGDDMGLGKTVQAIGAALFLKELDRVKRVLVICPASLKFQWAQEIRKLSSATARIVSGSARQRDEQYRQANEDFLILNYELLYRDLNRVMDLKADIIILDEAQRIKNWEAKISRSIKCLQSPYKLVLTGTPLENKLPEFQSLLEFLDPNALGAAWKLIPTYADFDAEDRVIGYSRLDHLKMRVSRYFIRRTRKEVLDQLPKRTDNTFWTPITPQQSEVHDEMSRKISLLMNKYNRFGRLTQEDIKRLFMYLTCMRIVANAYGQFDWKHIQARVLSAKSLTAGLKKDIGSPKLEEFRNVASDLLETPGQKIVVFSQWERMIRLAELTLRDLLAAKGEASVIFCGSLSMKKREATIKQFLEDPKTRIFFSTDSGSVGLNLQNAANCVINLEIPWNPAVMEQRIGRVHRMGQKKSVQVINFVSSESVEERIFALVKNKKALFAGVFEENIDNIRFTRNQAGSFMEKMKSIVPLDSSGSSDSHDPETSADGGEDNAAEALDDRVSGNPPAPFPVSEAGSAGPLAQPERVIDLGSLASLLGPMAAPSNGGASRPAGNLHLKIREDGDQLHVSIPKPAVAVLKSLRPLLDTLILKNA